MIFEVPLIEKTENQIQITQFTNNLEGKTGANKLISQQQNSTVCPFQPKMRHARISFWFDGRASSILVNRLKIIIINFDRLLKSCNISIIISWIINNSQKKFLKLFIYPMISTYNSNFRMKNPLYCCLSFAHDSEPKKSSLSPAFLYEKKIDNSTCFWSME